MKKERWIITIIACVLALALVIGLWSLVSRLWTSFLAAGSPETAPSRMALCIDVALHPQDPDFNRTYSSQENLTDLLHLLREMHTDDVPEAAPSLTDGQSYYSATVTYANGSTAAYHILGHRYLQCPDGVWHQVDPALVMTFNQFLRSHPTDNGQSPPPVITEPAETTEPIETTPPESTGEIDA